MVVVVVVDVVVDVEVVLVEVDVVVVVEVEVVDDVLVDEVGGWGASDVVVTTGGDVSGGGDETGPAGAGSALRPRPNVSGAGLSDGTNTTTTNAANPTMADPR